MSSFCLYFLVKFGCIFSDDIMNYDDISGIISTDDDEAAQTDTDTRNDKVTCYNIHENITVTICEVSASSF